ncbi:MAG: hypothetical protein EA344_11200 [Alkalicoccus sp.]|nr:MAG: hypothetical protein EA344_11200 [Alkalicoccus sp.]
MMGEKALYRNGTSCLNRRNSGAVKAGRKKSAEAGPPGKLPYGNEGGRSLLICFIFKAAFEERGYYSQRKLGVSRRHLLFQNQILTGLMY